MLSIYPQMKAVFPGENYSSKLLSGGTAGAISVFFANPADVLKCRLQASDGGAGRTLFSEARAVVREGGLRGFAWGVSPNMQRAFIVNAAELGTYDQAKTMILDYLDGFDREAHRHSSIVARDADLSKTEMFYRKESLTPPACAPERSFQDKVVSQFGASIIAGFASAVACNPVDVLKARQMVGGNKYSGTLDCLRKTVAEDGASALYRGFIPNWFRKAPWCIIFFLTYENLISRPIGHRLTNYTNA
jgi:hypothetical protein